MFSKKLVCTLGVLAVTAIAPATAAQAAPKPVVDAGTQVGSEGVHAPHADGIIAILIGAHGCWNCPHPAGAIIEPTKQEFPNLVTQQSRAR